MKASKVVQSRDVQGLDLIKVTDTRGLVTVEYEDWTETFSIAEARMLLDAIEVAWERGGECEMKSARRLMVERDFFGVAIQIHVERGWPACLVKKESDALCDMLREVFERRSCVVPRGCERVEMRCDECFDRSMDAPYIPGAIDDPITMPVIGRITMPIKHFASKSRPTWRCAEGCCPACNTRVQYILKDRHHDKA